MRRAIQGGPLQRQTQPAAQAIRGAAQALPVGVALALAAAARVVGHEPVGDALRRAAG